MDSEKLASIRIMLRDKDGYYFSDSRIEKTYRDAEIFHFLATVAILEHRTPFLLTNEDIENLLKSKTVIADSLQ